MLLVSFEDDGVVLSPLTTIAVPFVAGWGVLSSYFPVWGSFIASFLSGLGKLELLGVVGTLVLSPLSCDYELSTFVFWLEAFYLSFSYFALAAAASSSYFFFAAAASSSSCFFLAAASFSSFAFAATASAFAFSSAIYFFFRAAALAFSSASCFSLAASAATSTAVAVAVGY